MKTFNFTIIRNKMYKGPDTICYWEISIKDALDMERELYLIFDIIDAQIRKYHKISIIAPIEETLKYIPKCNKKHYHGEFLTGSLLVLTFSIKRYSESTINCRYYSKELEFERMVRQMDHSISFNDIDLETYEGNYSLSEMRNGVEVKPIQHKISYSRC